MAEDIVIRAEGIGKKYLIGHAQDGVRRYVTLRDVLARGARNLWRRTAGVARGGNLLAGDSIEEFWALRDLSFEVRRGEIFGIIGRNGAGKSTLLKILSRITEPSTGRVTIKGRVASLLEVGTGFHPELTGRENIYLNGAIIGMSRAEMRRKFDEIVAFSEVEQFLDTPVKRYSSGMYVRLAFAVAAHLEPEILVVDEVLSVGDAAFQKKCLGKMGEGSRRDGRTVLFVSHNLGAVMELCSRSLLLEAGQAQFNGSTSNAITAYLAATKLDAEVDLSHATRKGPQRYARLRRLELLNSEGQPTTFFQMSNAFIARIEVECVYPMPDAQIGVKITSRFGATIHYLASTWEGARFDLEPGVHRFEVKMPQVMMYPGTYLIGAWISRGDPLADDDFTPEVAAITVLKGPVNGHDFPIEKWAQTGTEVYAPSEWKKVSNPADKPAGFR